MTLSERAIAATQRREPHPLEHRKGAGKRPRAMRVCPECGCVLDEPKSEKKGHKRNLAHHRLFFKTVSLVTRSWPDDHPEFRPYGNADTMRAWLLIRAGHCQTLDMHLSAKDAKDPQRILDFTEAAWLTARRHGWHYCRVEARESESGPFYCVLVPRSINWDSLSEQEFRAVHERVLDVLEMEGISTGELLRRAFAELKGREEVKQIQGEYRR